MKEIYFIRHGQTDYNKRRIVQGSGVDSDLNETGKAQARAFFEAYQSVDFEVVFTSALKRTQQTVADFTAVGIPTEQRNQLNEMGWGDNEGRSANERDEAAYKAMTAAWHAGNIDASMPNGETLRSLILRLTDFLEELKKRPESRILVCTHGRAMLCLLTLIHQQHPREMEYYQHSNVGLYKFDFDGEQFSEKISNGRQHLEHLVTTK